MRKDVVTGYVLFGERSAVAVPAEAVEPSAPHVARAAAYYPYVVVAVDGGGEHVAAAVVEAFGHVIRGVGVPCKAVVAAYVHLRERLGRARSEALAAEGYQHVAARRHDEV